MLPRQTPAAGARQKPDQAVWRPSLCHHAVAQRHHPYQPLTRTNLLKGSSKMSNKTLRVGVIQQPAWPDKAQSLAETERLLKQLVEAGKPELVLLQELHCTH